MIIMIADIVFFFKNIEMSEGIHTFEHKHNNFKTN